MSSPLVLSLSTVFALVGIVLVAIAFGTNNWQEYKVNRAAILRAVATNNSQRLSLGQDLNRSSLYFDRTYGLFRECFPNQTPNEFGTYLSPLGATCVNIRDYQIPEDRSVIDIYSEPEKTRMHLMRTTVAFYIVGLAFLFFCLFTGISGCWRRSPSLILTTGILLLFATLFLAAAMAVWHGVDYLQREVIDRKPLDRFSGGRLFKSWPAILKNATETSYGWSYMISWIGIGFVLISSVLMLAAYRAMKEEEREEYEKKRSPYVMASPNYYDKSGQAAMMPYGYANYGGYAYPAYSYGGYGGAMGGNNYYGYLTYGAR